MANKMKNEARDWIGSKQERAATVDRAAWDPETRTIDLAFSSAAPYERFWGIEILDHSPGAARMDRFKDGAAVLRHHNWEKPVGAIKSASIDSDEFGRAKVRLSRNRRGEEIARDMDDDIPPKVSVGYIVHKMVLEEENKDGLDVYRVTDWEPYEISFVSVPADPSVGVGREMEITPEPKPEPEKESIKMADEVKPPNVPAEPAVDVAAVTADARKDETDRVAGILAIGRKFGYAEKADQAIKDGMPLAKFQRDVFESYKIPESSTAANIGMTGKETQRFSIARAINAVANPGNQRLQEAAAFELECSRAAEGKLSGGSRQGNLAIPQEALSRDLTVGTPADGGYLKGTDHLGGSFIDVLRNKAKVVALGAKTMSGLVGDIAIPTFTTANLAYWVAEATAAASEGAPKFGTLALAPKTVAGYVDMSRKLIQQSSPDVDGIIIDDLTQVLGLGVDWAALHGRGLTTYNEPVGIAGTDGIGEVDGDTNGLAPALAHIVELETDVSVANADVGNLAYLTSAKMRGKLRQIFPNTTGGDIPLWTNNGEPGSGMLNGYRAEVSNQVSDTLTKGNSDVCSALFFGNWADLIIALWGGLDILVDPFSASSTGNVRITAFQSCDIGVRHPGSFSAMLDALSA